MKKSMTAGWYSTIYNFYGRFVPKESENFTISFDLLSKSSVKLNFVSKRSGLRSFLPWINFSG